MDRKMMQQLQQMQRQMEQAQEELGNAEVEGTAGGGAVRVTMNGHREFKTIEIAPEAVDPEDVETLQDMIVAAINDASRKGTGTEREEARRHDGRNAQNSRAVLAQICALCVERRKDTLCLLASNT